MNEKFNKDEVCGTLGKVTGKVQRKKLKMLLMRMNQKRKMIPIYPMLMSSKDDFFDSLSSNALNRQLNYGRTRFSEEMKLDTYTPKFQVLPQQLSILVKQAVRISKPFVCLRVSSSCYSLLQKIVLIWHTYLQALPKGEWFCLGDCDRTHTSLGAMKKKQVQQGLESSAEHDIRWMLLSCEIASNDTRVLLSKAVAIFIIQGIWLRMIAIIGVQWKLSNMFILLLLWSFEEKCAIGLDNFIKRVKLVTCGPSYAVVAVMGPQSSGNPDYYLIDKSTGFRYIGKGITTPEPDGLASFVDHYSTNKIDPGVVSQTISHSHCQSTRITEDTSVSQIAIDGLGSRSTLVRTITWLYATEAEERERAFSRKGRWNHVRSLADAKTVMKNLFNLALSSKYAIKQDIYEIFIEPGVPEEIPLKGFSFESSKILCS
ncbi:zinc finger, PHD-type [Artemisia annua]|uniref:Zinc finger, PHD-type n=1 Tax=Artemisia annua TaxID=35608 RepID=A0A2U1KAB0_ARTAN|nr:zinc finger, PHD-type [Artemisia annua]